MQVSTKRTSACPVLLQKILLREIKKERNYMTKRKARSQACSRSRTRSWSPMHNKTSYWNKCMMRWRKRNPLWRNHGINYSRTAKIFKSESCRSGCMQRSQARPPSSSWLWNTWTTALLFPSLWTLNSSSITTPSTRAKARGSCSRQCKQTWVHHLKTETPTSC